MIIILSGAQMFADKQRDWLMIIIISVSHM